jgi:hypothetical protein
VPPPHPMPPKLKPPASNMSAAMRIKAALHKQPGSSAEAAAQAAPAPASCPAAAAPPLAAAAAPGPPATALTPAAGSGTAAPAALAAQAAAAPGPGKEQLPDDDDDDDAAAAAVRSALQRDLQAGLSEPVPECLRQAGQSGSALLFLGTGSAEPSKYRGPSGVLLLVDTRAGAAAGHDTSGLFGAPGGPASACPSAWPGGGAGSSSSGGGRAAAWEAARGLQALLIDCGEGTAGQLVRLLGPAGAAAVLRRLRCVWVSHKHADHMLGLPGLLAARAAACAGRARPEPPLLVSGPRHARDWLLAQPHPQQLGSYRFVHCTQLHSGSLLDQQQQVGAGPAQPGPGPARPGPGPPRPAPPRPALEPCLSPPCRRAGGHAGAGPQGLAVGGGAPLRGGVRPGAAARLWLEARLLG